VEIFLFYLHRGLIDVGFLGGAQVDRHGSINTTVIGRYDRPKVRLPGSGGASEIAALARRVFIIGRQSTQSFVEKLDFTTSPGRLADGQRPAGAPGGGPELVITDLGTYRFDGRGEMTVATLHPGVSPDEVRANTGWDIAIPSNWETTPPPTAVELEALGQIT
jgi:glutaconate CoA-transferase subunit B